MNGNTPGSASSRVDVRRLKDLAPIAQVVASCGVQLHPKSGGEYSCLCPFHDDHNPSMSVVPAKKAAFCHSCGWSGDAILFVREHRSVGFREACDVVAGLQGLTLEAVSERAEAALTPEQREERRRRQEAFAAQEAERQRLDAERKRSDAAALWESAAGSENHEALWAYFRHRGIAMKNVRTLPASLRFAERMVRNPQKEDEAGVGVVELPGLLAAMIHPERAAGSRVVAVQRIYFRADGQPGKWDGGGDAKLTLGKMCKGARIVLRSPKEARTLIICEGIETGMAIVDAVSAEGAELAAVWSVLSTAGLKNVQLTADEVKRFTRVIIAADADRLRWKRYGDENIASAAGLDAAFDAQLALREAGVADVRVVPPTPAVAKVAPLGWPVNKSEKTVDWLDAVADEHAGKLGDGAVCASLLNAAGLEDGHELRTAMANRLREIEGRGVEQSPFDMPDGGGSGGGAGGSDAEPEEGPSDDQDIMPKANTLQAQKVLNNVFAIGVNRLEAMGCGSAWPVAYAVERWWVWTNIDGDSVAPRWVPIEQSLLVARILAYTDTLKEWVRGKDGQWVKKRFTARPQSIVSILEAMKAYVSVMGSEMPRWLPKQLDHKGRATFGHAVTWEPALKQDRELPEPKRVVSWKTCLIDTEAFVEEPAEAFISHTPRWFSTVCTPVELHQKDLLRLALIEDDVKWHEGGEIDAYFAKRCPVYLKFVRQVLQGLEDQVRAFEEFAGYCLTGDTSLHKLLWMQGPSGSGKSLLAGILHELVGRDNVAMINIGQMSGRFDMAGLEGRAIFHMDEARVGPMTDTPGAMDNFLRISSGQAVRLEEKGGQTRTVKLSGKIVVTLNEEPSWKDAASALTRRILMCVTGDPPKADQIDRALGEKLRAELQWIAMRALLRLRVLVRRGDFLQPEIAKPIIVEMGRSMDDVRAFVDDECQVHHTNHVGVDELFKAFTQWYQRTNLRECQMSAATFGKRLRAAVGVGNIEVVQRGGVHGRARRYEGIGLMHTTPEIYGQDDSLEITAMPPF